MKKVIIIMLSLVCLGISFLLGSYVTIMTQTPTEVTEEVEGTRAIYIQVFGQEHEYILEQ